MSEPVPDVTLQFNLSAGDLAYAEHTIPALIATHRPDVREVLIVADACRPQSTPFLHAPSRFPANTFGERVARLREMCARWLAAKVVDRVEWLEPVPERVTALNRKYSGRGSPWTHDHLGHAYAAYFAGWEAPRTRYVLHFDADVLLHQSPGFSWIRQALGVLARRPSVLTVSPRIAPPLPQPDERMIDFTQAGIGWQDTWEITPDSEGWRSAWLSTRCHLLDRERLASHLPLIPTRGAAADVWCERVNRLLFPLYDARGWISDRPVRGLHWLIDRLARRLAHRVIPAWPLPPEVLFYERALRRGFECFYLGDSRAWYIHPDTKPPAFVELLPRLLTGVKEGMTPTAQRGYTGVRFDEWRAAPLNPVT